VKCEYAKHLPNSSSEIYPIMHFDQSILVIENSKISSFCCLTLVTVVHASDIIMYLKTNLITRQVIQKARCSGFVLTPNVI